MYLIILLLALFVVLCYYKEKEFFTNQTISYNFNNIYENQIADRVRPPNVYMTDDMQYTPETVMANLNDVRQTVDRYNTQLPDIIASSVTNSIQPMVKGMMSPYYDRQCPDA